MPTIKQIAHLAGVSRGTVDRVLNNRGSVDPGKAEKVREIAKAMNYTPNIAGKTLALAKKKLCFGFVLFGSTASNPFFEDVMSGIAVREELFAEYGARIETRFAAIDQPEQQVALIEELLELGVDGLAITPINHPMVAQRLACLKNKGIPFVTVNSDIPDSDRLAYVGSNYYKSGQTAAGIMRMATGGRANVGIVMGSPWVLCHSERVAGFTNVMRETGEGTRITGTVVNNDDDLQSFLVTRELLQNHPETDALFLAAAGVAGACRAVEDLGRAGSMKIICYDTPPSTCRLLRDGTILASIAQQPFVQGVKPLDILMDYVGMGIKPKDECFYTDIEIKIRENLD